MILGVYWYFDFPTSLYEYKFFKFNKGFGGHGDGPASLIADVIVRDINSTINELLKLVSFYEGSTIYINKMSSQIRIEISDYAIHDFEFELALKIEDILKTENAELHIKDKYDYKDSIELSKNTERQISRLSKDFLQLVGSPIRKHNAETASIRFDCNIASYQKESILNELNSLTNSSNINVVYYLEKECTDQLNLMLFFSNGRQGVNLSPKQNVDITRFENGLDLLLTKYNIKIGHMPGFDNYPGGGKPQVLKIVDSEFILG